MKTLVVFFALTAVACGSLVTLAQPHLNPAAVLDPHGRPLETSDVINARAVHLQAKALEHHDASLVQAIVAPVAYSVAAPVTHIAPAVYAAPAAVSHQSRLDVRTSPAIISHSVVAPVITQTAYTSPLLAHSVVDVAEHAHLLKKRSLAAYAVVPSAVSQQSRVDVISEPAVIAHSVATPLISEVVVAPAAVSHQSRVDVRSSPAVVSHAVTPLINDVWDATVYGAHAVNHGHLLNKRSLAAYAVVPSAVSQQSRVDVISEPVVIAHSVGTPLISKVVVAPAAVSHQSRVDVRSSPAVVSHAVTPLIHDVWDATVYAAHAVNHGHLLKKRSLAAYAVVPSAVSQQSRVDVISEPAVVAHSVATPLISKVVVAPAAISHQSRVDVRSSPAVVSHAVTPLVDNVWDATVFGAHALTHGHLLKKRSLGEIIAPVVHTVPAAVSQQSRVDVISQPAVVAHEVVVPVIARGVPVAGVAVAPAVVATPAAVSHQTRLDVISKGALAHSAVWSAPAARWGHAGLLKALW